MGVGREQREFLSRRRSHQSFHEFSDATEVFLKIYIQSRDPQRASRSVVRVSIRAVHMVLCCNIHLAWISGSLSVNDGV